MSNIIRCFFILHPAAGGAKLGRNPKVQYNPMSIATQKYKHKNKKGKEYLPF